MLSKTEKLEVNQKRILYGRRVFAIAGIVSTLLTGACAAADLFNLGAGLDTLQIWALVALDILLLAKVIDLSEDLIKVQRALISEYKAR